MEDVKLTFLGTANAVPTKKRNHTAILVSFKDENILVDCGEGTQRQLRYAEISPTKITRILITHWHGDHILGIPGLLQTLAMSQYSKKLKVYGPKGTKRFMSIIQELMIDFHIDIEINEVSGKFIDEKDFQIQAEEMSHGIPANAYSIILKDKIRLDKKKIRKLKLPNSPLLKQLQEGRDVIFKGKKISAKSTTFKEKGKKISFILDTGMNENAIKLSKDSDIIVCESTFLKKDKEIAKEYKHLTAEEAATIAKKAKAKQLILTHVSQRYEHFPEVMVKEAKKIFKNTKIVYDLDTLTI